MKKEAKISGVSENLSESITKEKKEPEKQSDNVLSKKKRIAISVSISEDLELLGLSKQHLDDISIEIARYLMVNGATMVYGGDLRSGGFTSLFSELSYQYKYLNDKQFRFVNYFSFPNSIKVSLNDQANFIKQQVEPIILNTPKHLGVVDKDKEYNPNNNVKDRYIYSECFSDMRIKMANNTDARILLGGVQKGFLGYIPGIIEEAYQTLLLKKPIYLLGGFGGATKTIIEVIQKRRPKEFTNEFQFDTDFLKEFRTYCEGKSAIPLDYDFLYSNFQNYSIGSLSELNGLSIDENQLLFESTNIHELVFLIIKGLQNISK